MSERRIATLIAAAYLYTNPHALYIMDRFAEAKNEMLLAQAIAEAYRIVIQGLQQGDIKIEQGKIVIKSDKEYVIEGELPKEKDVADFLSNYSYYNVTKTASIAMAIANEAMAK